MYDYDGELVARHQGVNMKKCTVSIPGQPEGEMTLDALRATAEDHLGTLSISKLVILEKSFKIFGHPFTANGHRIERPAIAEHQSWEMSRP